MTIQVDHNYALTLLMIVLILVATIAGAKVGVTPADLHVDALLGGLLVLAGRLIKSD